MDWTTLLVAGLTLIGSLLGSWLATRASLKITQKTLAAAKDERKEAREQEINRIQEERNYNLFKAQAEDLDNILAPALTSHEIIEFINRPGEMNQYWFSYCLADQSGEIQSILGELLVAARVNVKITSKQVLDLLRETLERTYDLYPFMLRYNIGTVNRVEIDVDKLNEDIEFVNKILGKHYKTYKLDGK